MAPEVSSGNEYNCQADIWSFGIMLYEMACFKVDPTKIFQGVFTEPKQKYGFMLEDVLRKTLSVFISTSSSMNPYFCLGSSNISLNILLGSTLKHAISYNIIPNDHISA